MLPLCVEYGLCEYIGIYIVHVHVYNIAALSKHVHVLGTEDVFVGHPVYALEAFTVCFHLALSLGSHRPSHSLSHSLTACCGGS